MSTRKQHGCNAQVIAEEFTALPAPLEIQVRVIDQYGYPLEGAHVMNSESSFATITNGQGSAMIQGYPYHKIIFSHIGKETKAIPFTGLSNQEVVLEDQIETLEEVIITNAKKKNTWLWVAAVLGLGYMVFRKKQPKKVSL